MKLRRTKIEPLEKKHLRIIGGMKMGKTVKARFSKGVIKPLEKVEI
jgi:hypothetical protein